MYSDKDLDVSLKSFGFGPTNLSAPSLEKLFSMSWYVFIACLVIVWVVLRSFPIRELVYSGCVHA